MSRHSARIAWRSTGEFAGNGYSRGHAWRFDGGQIVRASASPAVVPEPRSDPYGVDPEEALVAAVSSCHMLWFLDLARQAGFAIAAYDDEAVGEMGRIGPGRHAITRIVLRPVIAFDGAAPDAGRLAGLHAEAHERCFIANSLKSEIVVEAADVFDAAPATDR